MKNLIFLAVAALVVVGTSVLALDHYHSYKNNQLHTAQVAAVKKADELALEQAHSAALTKAYATVHVECEKGAAAYGYLTTLLKAKTPQPVCGPAVLQ